jgi:hypothetical protein
MSEDLWREVNSTEIDGIDRAMRKLSDVRIVNFDVD